jgi:hypothetical protein
MRKRKQDKLFDNIPTCATEFIKLVIKKMRYRRKVRAEVMAELAAHFEDELKDCTTDEEKEQRAKQLIEQFGDVKLLGVLLRRAKKRCRPLWRKALVRSFQVLGIIFSYLLICFSPLIMGKPTVTVNYVDWLNEVVRAGRDEADNARPYYEKAIDVCVEMPDWLSKSKVKWPTDFNDVEINGLTRWLDDNKQTFELIKKAVELPYYWNDYKSPFSKSETSFLLANVSNVMKPLTGYRKLAYLLKWQIRFQAYLGNIDTALKDCLAMQKLSSHMQGKGLLIEQLVGISIEALGQSGILDVLSRNGDIAPDSLRRFQQQLEQLSTLADVISFEAEKVFFYDLVQRTFTDDGQGSGRVLLKGLPLVADNWKSYVFYFLTMNLPDRQEVIGRIDKFYEQADSAMHKTPLRLHKEGFNLSQVDDNLLLGVLTPAFDRVIELSSRLKVSRWALVAIVAIMRYEKEKGQYPESLNELITSGYLKELPTDPYSDKPLVYKKTDDNFVLYSVGLNFKDDGGEVFRDEKGRVRKWADKGDWVFWPAQKK